MSSGTIPAAAHGPGEPPQTTPAATPDGAPGAAPVDGEPRGLLSSLMVPVAPARPLTDTTNPDTADGAAVPGDSRDVPASGSSSAAFHDTDQQQNATNNAKDALKLEKRPGRAIVLALAQRLAKGGGTANKRLDVAKIRAEGEKERAKGQQTKTTETVKRADGGGASSSLFGGGGTDPARKPASGNGADKGAGKSAAKDTGAGKGGGKKPSGDSGRGSSGTTGGGRGSGRGAGKGNSGTNSGGSNAGAGRGNGKAHDLKKDSGKDSKTPQKDSPKDSKKDPVGKTPGKGAGSGAESGKGGGRGASAGTDKAGSGARTGKDNKTPGKDSKSPKKDTPGKDSGSGRGTDKSLDKGDGKKTPKSEKNTKADQPSTHASTPASTPSQERARRRQDRRDTGQEAKLQGRGERRAARLERQAKDQDAARDHKYDSKQARQQSADKVRNARVEADAGRREQARQAKFEERQQRAKERAEAKRQKPAPPAAPAPKDAPAKDPKPEEAGPKTADGKTSPKQPADLTKKQPVDLVKKPKTADSTDKKPPEPDKKTPVPDKPTTPPAPHTGTHATPRRTQKAREAGYRHGTHIGEAAAQAGAYRDGIKDGITARTDNGRREKGEMDAIHAGRNKQREEHPVTTAATSADHHQNTAAPGQAQPIPAAAVNGKIHLGPGAARKTISRGEVRSLRDYQGRLGEKAGCLQQDTEETVQIKAEAEDLATRALQLLETARSLELGDASIGAATTANEAVGQVSSLVQALYLKLVRGTDQAQALNINTEIRYGQIYKAVADSVEKAPANDMSYYTKGA